jgi:hypothetical protein
MNPSKEILLSDGNTDKQIECDSLLEVGEDFS